MKTANLAIMFTDIVGYTAATASRSRSQQASWQEHHDRILTPIFKGFGGRIIKTIGDAYLVTFDSPTDSVLCGTAIQDALFLYNSGLSQPDDQIHVRVVVNMGEVRLEKGDIFGEPVNIAARIESLAEAGEVVFTQAIYLAMNKNEVSSQPRGEHALKGITEPVGLHTAQPSQLDSSGPASGIDTSGCPFRGVALTRLLARGVHLPYLGAATVTGKVADTVSSMVQGMGRRGEAAAVPSSKSRLRNLAVAAAALLLVGLVWLTSQMGQDQLDQLFDAVDQEDWQSAAQILTEIQKDAPKAWDDVAQAYIASGRGQDRLALQKYRAAVGANKKLGQRPQLVRDVAAYLDDYTVASRAILSQCWGDVVRRELERVVSDDEVSYTGRLAAAEMLLAEDRVQAQPFRLLAREVLGESTQCNQRKQAVQLLGVVGLSGDVELLEQLGPAQAAPDNPADILAAVGQHIAATAANHCLGSAPEQAIRKIRER